MDEKEKLGKKKWTAEKKRKARENKRKQTQLSIDKEGYDPLDQVTLVKLVQRMIENLDKGLSGLGEDCWTQEVAGKLKFTDGPPRVSPFVYPWDKRILEGGLQESQPSWGCYYRGNCMYYTISRQKNKDVARYILMEFAKHVKAGAYKSTFDEPNIPTILSKEDITKFKM